MPAADTSVKFLDSTMPNSPVLNGQVGSLVSLLDACLVGGFGSVNISSLVIAGDVATVETSAPHGFSMAGLTGPVVKISGASVTAVNTEWRVASVTNATKFLVAMPGVTGPVSGSMTVKYAPLGWTKAFEGTNKAAYKGNERSNGHYLQVIDDSTVTTSAAGRWAKWRGYEAMTDVDSGIMPFPATAQVATGLQVMKSKTADSVRREWALVGDSASFYLFAFWSDSSYINHAGGYFFGKTGSLRAADGYDTLIIGDEGLALPSYPGTSNRFASVGSLTSTSAGFYLARSHTQIGSSVPAMFMQPAGAAMSYMGYNGSTPYPCPLNNGLIISPVALAESLTRLPRNLSHSGLYTHWHSNPLTHGDCIDNIDSIPGRTLRCYNANNGSNVQAQCMIDITGPWR